MTDKVERYTALTLLTRGYHLMTLPELRDDEKARSEWLRAVYDFLNAPENADFKAWWRRPIDDDDR